MKRIKTLQSQNVSLAAQVRKLQASLARCSGQTAQPSTCLLVLIMSLALVLAPTMRNSPLNSENNEDEGISLSEDGSTTSLNAGKYHSNGNKFNVTVPSGIGRIFFIKLNNYENIFLVERVKVLCH